MLAFVAAEAREFKGLLGKVERVTRLNWPLDFARSGWLRDRAVLLVANGPGARLAGRAADVAKEYGKELDGLASVGFCGALSAALEPCDIFVATEIHFVAHALSVPLSHPSEHCKTGKLLSMDRVASTADEKAALYRETGAEAIEMEAAGLAIRAKAWSVPFYAIRVVTDTATESFPLDFNRLRDRAGRFSRTRILAAALRRPAVVPALLHLNQRCNTAANALGDFLADARF
ncbi:MAG TPA: hypothetical protein VEV17_08520 [Bryobacteraceae bacterium]|nr:hypothetical protein [Bryobacteraceae bacterium]